MWLSIKDQHYIQSDALNKSLMHALVHPSWSDRHKD